MLKQAAAAVGALTTLALATTSEAASGLPTGKRQHKPFTIMVPTDKSMAPHGVAQWSDGTARSGAGFLRSMDGGATWHHATVPTGSVRFLIDSPRSIHRTGRTTGLAVDPAEPHRRHAAAANGGAWKTKDGGASWLPMRRDTVTTLPRGTVGPHPIIRPQVHVITNAGGSAGLLGRAPGLRWW